MFMRESKKYSFCVRESSTCYASSQSFYELQVNRGRKNDQTEHRADSRRSAESRKWNAKLDNKYVETFALLLPALVGFRRFHAFSHINSAIVCSYVKKIKWNSVTNKMQFESAFRFISGRLWRESWAARACAELKTRGSRWGQVLLEACKRGALFFFFFNSSFVLSSVLRSLVRVSAVQSEPLKKD